MEFILQRGVNWRIELKRSLNPQSLIVHIQEKAKKKGLELEALCYISVFKSISKFRYYSFLKSCLHSLLNHT